MKTVKITNSLELIESVVKDTSSSLDVRMSSIYVNNGNKKVLLFETRTSPLFLLRYVYDDSYIVVYTIDVSMNAIKVQTVYDIKNNKILKLDDKKRFLFRNMYVAKVKFDVQTVLQYINESNLGITSNNKIKFFEEYITGGNKNISKQEVINYILECYPILKKYTDIKGPLSITNFNNIMEKINAINYNYQYRFHVMKQIVE